jgi:hypothetical protein
MPKHCTICGSTEKTRIAGEMIAAGATDGAIGKAVGIGRMSVFRHRTTCVLGPAKALAEAAGKGREVVEQRAQLLAAAEAGDPAAFIGLQAIVSDLKKVHERLERAADVAEDAKSANGVATVSAQQIRASEVRAKIGGVGGYAPAKSIGAGEGAQFNLIIQFSEGHDERISATVVDPAAAAPTGRTFDVAFTRMDGASDALPNDGDDNGAEFDDDV